MIEIDLIEFVKIFSLGLVSGVIVQVIFFMVGVVIDLAFKIFKS